MCQGHMSCDVSHLIEFNSIDPGPSDITPISLPPDRGQTSRLVYRDSASAAQNRRINFCSSVRFSFDRLRGDAPMTSTFSVWSTIDSSNAHLVTGVLRED